MKNKEILQKKLVYFAKKYLGKPYKYGAKPYMAPSIFDCSSFTQYLYKKIGIVLPRTALEQAHLGKDIKFNKGKLEVGDLIFFKGIVGRYDTKYPQGIGHVAIYIGAGKVINAKYKKNKDGSDGGLIEEGLVNKFLKRKDIVVIKRIIVQR